MQLPFSLPRKYFRFVLIFLAFVSLNVISAIAQDDQKHLLNGTFVIDRNASDDLNKAIEIATSRSQVLVKKMERSKLIRLHTPYPRITIAYDKKQVSIQLGDEPAVISASDGGMTEWKDPGGAKYQIRSRWNNGQLVQSFTGKNDGRTNTFTTSLDGRTLTMNVVGTSAHLAKPITYKLVYGKIK